MATDWLETLNKQADFAQRMVRDLPTMLAHRDFTWDRACRLYLSLEKGAAALGRIIEQMEKEQLDKPLCDAAAALQDVWAKLSAATAHKISFAGYRVDGLSILEEHPSMLSSASRTAEETRQRA
jgi:hypothetical protein